MIYWEATPDKSVLKTKFFTKDKGISGGGGGGDGTYNYKHTQQEGLMWGLFKAPYLWDNKQKSQM
jgi:hypothetical protein